MTTLPFLPIDFNFRVADSNRQTFMPFTSLLSPTVNYTTYKGDLQTEERIVSNVASFGRQLGILSEAVLALAEGKHDSDELERLRRMMARIEDVKRRNRNAVEERAKEAFESLAKSDPQRARVVLEAMKSQLETATSAER
ncbi:hypothetical protein [Methylobrevis pamukkalensis]|uniref:Uncharacterized protein n=1 Tax=Methylobrevis pamukkalensis TaxID=1439726 RepID=A0A1E3H605_9HYPH|nr:hypothetical protein [Methylobrevis pamukkalensis]ODN71744.1 hypothetical protein A6302_00886 [Methylobrevis pamukkalensis]